jgi:hypothetical protein
MIRNAPRYAGLHSRSPTSSSYRHLALVELTQGLIGLVAQDFNCGWVETDLHSGITDGERDAVRSVGLTRNVISASSSTSRQMLIPELAHVS